MQQHFMNNFRVIQLDEDYYSYLIYNKLKDLLYERYELQDGEETISYYSQRRSSMLGLLKKIYMYHKQPMEKVYKSYQILTWEMKIVLFIVYFFIMLALSLWLLFSVMLILPIIIIWESTKFLVNHLAYLVIIIQQLVLVKFTVDVVQQDIFFSDDITRLALQLMLIFFIPVLLIKDVRSLQTCKAVLTNYLGNKQLNIKPWEIAFVCIGPLMLRMFTVLHSMVLLFLVVITTDITYQSVPIDVIWNYTAILSVAQFDIVIMSLQFIESKRQKEDEKALQEETFFEKSENKGQLPIWMKKQQPLLKETGFLKIVVTKENEIGESVFQRYLAGIKNYLDVSYFIQAAGLVAWALFFYFLKYYHTSEVSGIPDIVTPLTYIEDIMVPAFTFGFPVTASSVLSTETLLAGRITQKYDKSSKGLQAWCANNNLTGEWIQLSNHDPLPLNWTLLSLGGRGDLTNTIRLNVTVSLSNNSYQFVSIGQYVINDIANRVHNYTLSNAVGRHLRIEVNEWSGANPCLRFEAYFMATVEREVKQP
ncbi:hypothetical protein FGO68_gene13560 [Halteria grandinella]|uniref:F5/8 type C domain-containing protein n=1 Tax=Halteria grandinella TaxID=5974 RepID=A0A8J8NUP4_HALGN|nr:hypothetical protein FGO68_gene13560 [Halteria grandinella]